MKKLINRLLIIICLFTLNGCRKDQFNDCFQGTGSDVTEIRAVAAFNKIEMDERFDVLLIQDTTLPAQIKITAGSKIIGQIIPTVKNQTLKIANKNVCNFVRSYDRKIRVEIRVKFLESIIASASANIKSEDTLYFNLKTVELKNFGLGTIDLKINAGTLNVRSVSSGNIFLEGFVNILSCSIEEVSMFDGRKLWCDDIWFDNHSPLDCFVNPKNRLGVSIFNKGNVYYLNEPTIQNELTKKAGSGELIKL